MSASSRPRLILILLVLMMLAVTAVTAVAYPHQGPLTVENPELLGMATFETGTEFAGTEVGGLSGITYNPFWDVYYVLSDDRSQTNPARYYIVDIDLADGSLDDGDVSFERVVYLREKRWRLFAEGTLDPEGIELVRPGLLFISSEGDAASDPPVNPFVNRFQPWGRQQHVLTIPDKFLLDGAETFGIRDNLAFESLTSTPNNRLLVTAVENALHQDGPPSTLTDESPARFLLYNARNRRPGPEYVYMVAPIPKDSDPAGVFADNGLVDLQAVDNVGTFVAVERSFAVGVGNTVRVFESSTQEATNVAGLESLLGQSYTPMSKELLFDFETDLGLAPDNIEGVTFGPQLPDGRDVLIFVSDNNFNPAQITQFIAVAVDVVAAE